ncbi:type IV pili methyl-accepting chemotaxis transducer N-terminal domain-containing protein [Teredinibacter sp. KSP-S5-2]|uniref:type IV pili methyl-accepting chemotaxis transducer N-terminal domain-containing protein n=1 Tax=Teredinibacter sp. KSP-S5-2 TaxID=3034506 RepID=UPI002934A282|nr:type IV pili methyl-accepting chemotaxis transducer N-terminal domain-containing protein [Teredinibacter sp. KSP-S5-2]WNO09456.1 type IV pili methyl-accepting chemotaxis transducer N-terminal domain-containing protein [Teredinibacter sp. KSP-S5-2]
MKNRPVSLSWITFFYVAALSLVAAIIVVNFFVVANILESNKSASLIINLAGRQRMLSQKIFLDVERRYQSSDDDLSLSQLDELVKEMEMVHVGLINGDKTIGLPEGSESVREYYFSDQIGFNELVQSFFQQIKTFKQQASDNNTNLKVTYTDLREIEDGLLKKLDDLVLLLQQEAEDDVEHIKTIESSLFVFALLVLLFEALFIFRPLSRQILAYVAKIELHRRELVMLASTRSQFLKNTSHILRTSLNHIYGFCSYLYARDQNRFSERERFAVEKIYEGSRYMKDSLDDFYELANLEERDRGGLIKQSELGELFHEMGFDLTELGECGVSEFLRLERSHIQLMLKTLVRIVKGGNAALTASFSSGKDSNTLTIVLISKERLGYLDVDHKDSKHLLLEGFANFYAGEFVEYKQDSGYKWIMTLKC